MTFDRFALPTLPRRAQSLSLALVLAALASNARADAYTQVQQLMDQGQMGAAEQQIASHRQQFPRDPQMRYLAAMAAWKQADLNKTALLLQELIREYPELPEPYNALAAVHAQRGDPESALAELQMAVRLRPDYAEAQENLGDVHAVLAQRSFARAAQAPASRSSTLTQKLSLAEQLVQTRSAPRPTSWRWSAQLPKP